MSRSLNLAKALDHPGYPTMRPHPYSLDTSSDWVSTCSQLFVRHVIWKEDIDDVCKDLKINIELARYLFVLMNTSDSNHYRVHYFKVGNTDEKIPPFAVRDHTCDRADEIGRAVYALAVRNAPMVRYMISVYARAVTTDKQIVFSTTESAQIEYVLALIEFIRKLPAQQNLWAFSGSGSRPSV